MEDKMDKKYVLTDETIIAGGHTLHRIKAIRDFRGFKVGDLGGYVESYANLSHEGDCWVADNALIYGNAKVFGDALVYEYARVYDTAQVYGKVQIYGQAQVYGNAQVCDKAWVSGKAKIYGWATVCDDAWVWDNAKVCGDARISGYAWVFGDSEVYDNAERTGIGEIKTKPSPKNYRELCWELRHLIFNPDLPEEMAQERIEILPGVYAQATSKRGKYYIRDTYNCWEYWEIGARDVYSLYKRLGKKNGWV